MPFIIVRIFISANEKGYALEETILVSNGPVYSIFNPKSGSLTPRAKLEYLLVTSELTIDVSIPEEPVFPEPMDPVLYVDPDEPGHLAPRHSSLCTVNAPTDAISPNIFIQIIL